MVEAGRNITHGFISVDGEMIVAKTTGSMAYLDTTTDFYLGKYHYVEDSFLLCPIYHM